MAQRSHRGKRNYKRSTEDGVAWNDFECKWQDVDVDDGARGSGYGA